MFSSLCFTEVLEKKKRAAQERAEKEARDAQEEEEIRRYHQKLRERERWEEQKRLNAIKLASNIPQSVPESSSPHTAITVQPRDQRVIGVMVPPKPTRKGCLLTLYTYKPCLLQSDRIFFYIGADNYH